MISERIIEQTDTLREQNIKVAYICLGKDEWKELVDWVFNDTRYLITSPWCSSYGPWPRASGHFDGYEVRVLPVKSYFAVVPSTC